MTAPVTPVTVRVTIDSQTLSDGSDDAATYALDGLAVVWGRTTTVDQPESSTATFTVSDGPAHEFMDACRVGKPVSVWATGYTQSDETVQTLEYPAPSWDLAVNGPAGARVQRRGDAHAAAIIEPNAAGTGKWLRGLDNGAKSGWRILIPPATPVPSSDPTGWDHITKTAVGQRWHVHLEGWAAADVPVRVQINRYRTPWSDPVSVLLTDRWIPADGPFDADYTPQVGGEWLGVDAGVGNASHGTRWVDVDPAITWPDYAGSWRDLAGFALDQTELTAPAGATGTDVLVFAGRITDAAARYEETLGTVLVDVTATDFLADLANRDVGDEPWPAETLTARVGRIITASGMAVATVIDAVPGGETVTRMDVDRQQVTNMLQELAGGVDAVLWPAAHATLGPYVWLEDMGGRSAAARLEMVGGMVEIVTTAPAGALTFDACDFELDPVQWGQSVADAATRVAVTWQDQSTQPDPTEHTETVIRADMETPGNIYGTRRVSVGSLVTSAESANRVANQLLRRLTPDLSWRATGFVWNLALDQSVTNDDVSRMLTLLDGTTRIGKPLVITDIPEWLPVAGDVMGYVEGGSYTYISGAWELDLTLSAAAKTAGDAVAWNELDTGWRWVDFDPAISWARLAGVSGPAEG